MLFRLEKLIFYKAYFLFFYSNSFKFPISSNQFISYNVLNKVSLFLNFFNLFFFLSKLANYTLIFIPPKRYIPGSAYFNQYSFINDKNSYHQLF